MPRPSPINVLPENYAETRHLVVTKTRTLVLLNALSLLPMGLSLLLMAGWTWLVFGLRGTLPALADTPWWLLLVALIGVIVLHEWLHGLAIRWTGHKPRYGMKLKKLVFYATSDGALFRRREFVIVALAPLVGITLAGMGLMLILPQTALLCILCVSVNAGSAIGDLVMVGVVLRYPPDSLVRDEEDSIRIFTSGAQAA